MASVALGVFAPLVGALVFKTPNAGFWLFVIFPKKHTTSLTVSILRLLHRLSILSAGLSKRCLIRAESGNESGNFLDHESRR
jgi:hypothetical protein